MEQLWLARAGKVRYTTRMASNLTDEDLSDFKNSLRVWMKQERMTAKALAKKLGLSHGTVSNWFCTDYNITERHRLAIESLMRGEVVEAPSTPKSLLLSEIRIQPDCNMARLWLNAAHIYEEFPFEEKLCLADKNALRLAKWITKVVMVKANQVCQASSRDVVREALDAVSDMDYQPERGNAGKAMYIPVFRGKFNLVTVMVALELGKRKELEKKAGNPNYTPNRSVFNQTLDDFIAGALNEEGEAEFERSLGQRLAAKKA